MNNEEKTIARMLFRNRILESNGQSFEDLFVRIMSYMSDEFQSIKPWGNIGDRKNDGYIRDEGTYFQVFAPEEIEKSYVSLVRKLNNDFEGLIQQWSPVNKFYFVVNDKYRGVNADCEQIISQIKENYSLEDCKILTAKDVENKFFLLEDDQIFSIIGFLPDPDKVKRIDYSILDEVIAHIMKLPLPLNEEYDIILPDLEDKIIFNNLTSTVANYLRNGLLKVIDFEEYLSNNSDFLADTLRSKLNEVYQQLKAEKSGDALFMAMVSELSPKNISMYQVTVIVIMSKYFETCDIFEEPKEEENL